MLHRAALLSALLLCLPAMADDKTYKSTMNVVYGTVDGFELKLDAFIPKGKASHAGVLVVHGGSWRGGSRRQLGRYARALAAEGIAAFAISYRLAPRFKHPAQIEDCRTAVRWLRTTGGKRFRVDPDRIGAIGYSAGAHLVTLLATTGMDKAQDPKKIGTRIRAAVGGGTPADFTTLPAALPILSYWLGKTRAQDPALYKAASPTMHVTKDDCPCYFFHGTADWLCSIAAVKRMQKKFEAAGVATGLHVCDGKGHKECAMDPVALDKSVEFLRKHLAPRKEKTKTSK